MPGSTMNASEDVPQLDLFASPEPRSVGEGWFVGVPERPAAARFTHLIRDPENDPKRAPRHGKGHTPTGWKKLESLSVSEWAARIFELLEDGTPRTFNRIALELSGFTGDVAFESALDRGLWLLVEQERLEWTGQAPIRFRAGCGPLEREEVPSRARKVRERAVGEREAGRGRGGHDEGGWR